MNMEIYKKINIELPSVPNFILVKGTKETVPVSEFKTDDELREIGAEWTDELIKKANKKNK
jgi:hypothetical protein